MFSLRIVSTSHYLAEPLKDLDVVYSSFRSADVHRIPILRIFGVTPAGQKTCMHIHGVFPYLFVPFDGTQPAESYMRRFAASLDKAINVASNSNTNTQHVFKISLVSGIPMYGYHAKEQHFMKIYMYNPSSIRKAADLLLGGAVMNKSFQPHEAHIPFPLQLFIDYNLYGMNLINVAAVKFRRPPSAKDDTPKPSSSRVDSASPDSSHGEDSGSGVTPSFSRSNSTSNTPTVAFWNMDDIPSELFLPSSVERQSSCELEVDVVAADILNRKEVTDNMGSNPGLAALWEDERQRRRDVGQISQIAPPDSQEHVGVESSESERELLQRLAEIIHQQHTLSQSESEESERSVEDSTLTPEDVPCVPASQLENHSEPSPDQDSQSSKSSQDTMIVSDEEDGAENEEAPIISLESIQRVVSFGQSFSQSNSQPTSSPPDHKAADQSLVEVLAALAEESSPSASQRSAAHISVLENQDSVVGQEVPVPPDIAALEEDEQETLHMSQTLPHEANEESSDHHDFDGLDSTWNGSSGDEKDSDCKMDSDDSESDDEIPQLDGASDEKQAPKKSRKRLGVRGPVFRTDAAGAGTERGVQHAKGTHYSVDQQVYNAIVSGSSHMQSSESGVTPPYLQYEQQKGYMGRQQWGLTSGASHQSEGFSASNWGQSPSSQGSHPPVYHSPGNHYSYYSHAQAFPHRSPFRQTGAPCSPGQASFSSSPHSPLSPPSHPSSGRFLSSSTGPSTLQYSSLRSSQAASSIPYSLHSERNTIDQGGQFQGSPCWQYPVADTKCSDSHHNMPLGSSHMPSGSAIGTPTSVSHGVPLNSPHGFSASTSLNIPAGLSPDTLQGPSFLSPSMWSASPSHSGQIQNERQSAMEEEHLRQYSYNQNPMETAGQNSCQPQNIQSAIKPFSFSPSQESQKAPSALQALLEAPHSTTVADSQGCSARDSSHRQGVSADSASGLICSTSHTAERNDEARNCEVKQGDSLSPVGTPTIGSSQVSALSGLYDFVSTVDAVVPPSASISCNPMSTTSLPTLSTVSCNPSPYVENRIDENTQDLEENAKQAALWQISSQPSLIRSAPGDESPSGGSASPLCHVKETMKSNDQKLGCSSSDVLASGCSKVSSLRNERLGKQSRLKKLGLSLNKIRQVPENCLSSPTATLFPHSAYTFTFHVPTPVYKRFKSRNVFPDRNQVDVNFVRMHPMDARRYSLLKIGRELVCLNRLSPRELSKTQIAGPSRSAEVVLNSHNKKNFLLMNTRSSELSSESQKAAREERASGRLRGPRCRRPQATVDGSCQTSGGVADNVSVGNPSVGSSVSVGSGGDSFPWQSINHDNCHSTKSDNASQSPTSSDHSQHGLLNKTQGQLGLVWHGRSHSPPWKVNVSKDQSHSRSAVTDFSESKQQPSVKQYPYKSSSELSSASSVTFVTSSSSSVSLPQPMAVTATTSSHSAGQNTTDPSSYSQSYVCSDPHNYGQLREQSTFIPSDTPQGSENKFAFPSTASRGHFPHGKESTQGGYPSSFNAAFHINYSRSGGKGSSGGQDSFLSRQQQQHQSHLQGYFPSSSQDQQMPLGEVRSFSHCENALPHGKFSPNQFPISHRPTEFSELSGYASQSSPSTLPQQNMFSSQSGQFPSSSHSGPFYSPPSVPNQPSSSPCQSGQFSTQLGQFPSPASSHGYISPHINQQSPISPQVYYQGLYSPGVNQQNQFSSPGSRLDNQRPLTVPEDQQQNYPQYTDTSQFSQSVQEISHSTVTPGISTGTPNSENIFLDSANSLDPFLPQGACQVLTTFTTKDPGHSAGTSDENKLPDRPKTTKEVDDIRDVDNKTDNRVDYRRLSVSHVDHPSWKQKSHSPKAKTSDNEFCTEQLKPATSKLDESCVADEKQNRCNSETVPVFQSSRRASVQLWSIGDSDSDDDTVESDESSDDYLPTSNLKRKRCKRKGSRRQNKPGNKHTKRSAAYCDDDACSRYLLKDVDKKGHGRSWQSKNHRSKRNKRQQLIEGVHYIVVGKFKGHRNMLVKVDRVPVMPDERVKVSNWQSGEVRRSIQLQEKGDGKQPRMKPRLLGPRCRRLARGILASDPSFIHEENNVDAAENSGNVSDASTIVADDLNATVCMESFDTLIARTDVECMLERKAGSDFMLQTKVTMKGAADTGTHKVLMRKTLRPPSDTKTANVQETCAELLKSEDKLQTSVCKEDISNIGEKNSRSKCKVCTKPSAKTKNNLCHCPENQGIVSDDVETSQDGVTDLPVSMEVDMDSKIPVSQSTSQTQSPIPKAGKRSSDSPFVSEHSQDADCSSLPQSNPDSTSSSPAFPKMLLTTTASHDQQECCGKLHKEEAENSLFSFHKVCEKVQEMRTSQRVEASSESSDSHDCYSEVQTRREDSHFDPKSDTFSWQNKLTSGTSEKSADIDKERLKKQKKLTTNQRLGVAFLSKRSRRRKSKMKASGKGEGGTSANKLMDSLSILHMATLASLGGENSKSCNNGSTTCALDKTIVEEKENHNVGLTECLAERKFPWKSSSFARENSDWKSVVQDASDTKRAILKMGFNPDKCASLEAVNSVVCCGETKVVSALSEKKVDCESHEVKDVLMTETSEHGHTQNSNMFREGDDSNETEDGKGCADVVGKSDTVCSLIGGAAQEESNDTSEDVDKSSKSNNSDEKDNEDSCEMTGKVTSEVVKPPLYDDSDENTDDYTVTIPKCPSKPITGCRKKRRKRKPKGRSNKMGKLLDSLDVLHMATLASLGTDPQPVESRDSLPRYSDCVCDHADDYEESLIRMSYTSPVHSDLGDMSPPIPLSPEELSKNSNAKIQKQRSMPCRLKFDESRGTRTVRMSQLRAENAAETSSNTFPLQSFHNRHELCSNQARSEKLEADNIPQRKELSPSKLHTPTCDSLPTFSKSVYLPVSTAGTDSLSLPKSSSFTHPTIPDPEKLPAPSIPWHQPLHVVTGCQDGRAWKERVIHDALTEKFQNRSNSLGDSTSPNVGFHQKGLQHVHNKMTDVSNFSGRNRCHSLAETPIFLNATHRENERTSPLSQSASYDTVSDVIHKTPPTSFLWDSNCENVSPVSAVHLKDVYNCGGDRAVSSGFSPKYTQRNGDGQIIFPTQDSHSERVDNVFSERERTSQQNVPNVGLHSSNQQYVAQSVRDGHCVNKALTHFKSQQSVPAVYGNNQQYVAQSERDGHCVNKFSPRVNVLQRDQPCVDPKTLSNAPGRFVDCEGSTYSKTPSYSNVSPRGRSSSGEKTPHVSDGQSSNWHFDRSNASSIPYQRSDSGSDQSMQPLSQACHSPRLSRTEMIISQMFNLDSSSALGKTQQTTIQSRPVKQPSKDRPTEYAIGSQKNRWRNCQNQDKDFQADYFQDKQVNAYSHSKSLTSLTSGSFPSSLPNVTSNYLYAGQDSTALHSSDRLDPSEKLSSLHSYTNLASDYSTKSVFSTNYSAEPQQGKSAKLAGGVFSDSFNHVPVKMTTACSVTESSSHFDKTRSSVLNDNSEPPSAYYDSYNSVEKSQGVYYPGNYTHSKSPGSYEKCANPVFKSPASHTAENVSGNSINNCMPDKHGFSPRSPFGSSGSSVFSNSSRSPGRGSPRGKNSETCRLGKGDASLLQNRKRSIGEYMEEMIESAYSEVLPGESRHSQSDISKFSSSDPKPLSSRQVDLCSRVDSVFHNTMITPQQTSNTMNNRTALDLTVSYKNQNTTEADVNFVNRQSLSSSLPISCTTVVSAMDTSTRCISHPTWTSIKTDDFENITDDEDEDVIPPSQEYSTCAYRFPGYRRLGSISSSWTPYNIQNQPYVSVLSGTSSKSTSDMCGRTNMSVTPISSRDYSKSIYHYDKGMYSQSNAASAASKLVCHTGLESLASSTEEYNNDASRTIFTQATQPTSQSLVSSFGTAWHDTQMQASAPSTSIMSQFEPITDSEEEEDGQERNSSQNQTSFSNYCSGYSPAAYTSSAFYPAYSSIRATTSYNSLDTSRMTMATSCSYPILLEDSVKRLSLPSSAGKQIGIYNVPGTNRSLPVSLDTQTTSDVINHNVSLSSSYDVSSVPGNGEPANSSNSLIVCGSGDGERHDDESDPEDGGGNRKKKRAAVAPSNDESSSSRPAGGTDGQGRQYERSSSQSDEKQGRNQWAVGPESRSSKHVLCPRTPPPGRRTVEASAASVGLSVEPVVRAFCSHAVDLPETPRELGGKVLRLATTRVAELGEMVPPAGCKGIGDWQSLQASQSPLLSSQSDQSTSDLALRLQNEPQLRIALAGDGPCVMTPVKLPPSRLIVTAWLEDQVENIQLDRKKKTNELLDQKVGNDSDLEMSLPLDIDVPVEECEMVGIRDSSGDDDDDDSMFTRLRARCREGEVEKSRKVHRHDGSDDGKGGSSSSPKRQRLDVDDVLHSTPVRRLSNELFDSGCTPIAADQRPKGRAGNEETAQQFVTPRRPPMRRLSTNTESALRRAILTTEGRQQSFEGETSQIDGPTPKNTHGFKVTQHKLQDAKALHKFQCLTVLSMELHADSRGDLMPDPEVDAIRVLFYAVFDDIPPSKGPRNFTGAIVVDGDSNTKKGAGRSPRPSKSKAGAFTSSGRGKWKRPLFEKSGILEELDITYVESEADLLKRFTELIKSLDPDILVGFEVQQMSWGFLFQRAAHLSVNLCAQIARIQDSKRGNRFSAEKDEWGSAYTSEIHIEGRVVLNLWRILRHEVTLNIYSYENCAFHILHHRVPAYTFRSLTSWYDHRTHLYHWRVIQHYIQRVTGQLAMIDQLDIIGKTSEFARVFGIEFYDVLSRGSQYRVESMMLRLAKPLNFIPVSPSVHQRARQKSAECIPLTLEPQSRFYTDPVVVLDFQSLYPSIMIAYNYCFSTCLGRLNNLAHAHEGPIEFGCTSLNISPETLTKLRKKVTVSPNGCVFVNQKVRRGVLPMMVEEILKTRLMVKKSMKDYKDDKALYRMLDARQLGLKLIANVTYGYTGASFSGRMPCIEVADSIVRKARESLERAIQLVEETTRWQAEVVYGDTDSLFIKLSGRSKEEAFRTGQEIADTVTNMFPKPMKLKFEKVYLPCALQTKKRYVGFMYETLDQKEPVFDAKGIETVRRDNCGVVSKVLERCIKILFTQRDLSQVRMYLQRQFFKMLSGRVGLQDYVFAKEYRGMMGYKAGACVPALEIARMRLREDRRSEPRVGERVPYVIVHGSPGLPLIQLVRQPKQLLQDVSLRINVTYYITKQVLPPLDRLLGLVGVSVFQWYNDMPKVIRVAPHVAPAQNTKQGTISQYFVTSDCLVCEQQTKQAVCATCLKDPQLVAVTLASRSAALESVQDQLAQVCKTCMGLQDESQPCVSLDCPVLFRRHLSTLDLSRADQQREALFKLLAF